MSPTGNTRKKVVGFFGSDLARKNATQFLQQVHSRGYNLLAFDSPAAALAAKAHLPFTTIDDWIGADRFAAALLDGYEAGTTWFEPGREDFTADGVCWPHVDVPILKWFWKDVLLALELAESFRRSDVVEFRFFRNILRRASVLFQRSDVCASLWSAEIGKIAGPMYLFDQIHPGTLWTAVQRRFSARTQTNWDTETRSTPISHEPPRGSIMLVLGPGEEYRFKDVVAELAQKFSGSVGVAFASPYTTENPEVLVSVANSVVYGPRWPSAAWATMLPTWLLPTVDRGLARQFSRAYETCIEASAGRAWHKPLRVLRHHFGHYCKYRWPFLCRVNLAFWSGLWSKVHPRAVVVTSREETIFGLAAVAAKALEIPVFMIPHGGVTCVGEPTAQIYSADVLCNSELQKRTFLELGISPERLHCAKGLLAASEYPVSSVRPAATKERARILALTEPTGEGPVLTKYTTLKGQMEALRALAHPPEDIVHQIQMLIKVHPKVSDIEVVEAAGSEVSDLLMPINSDLVPALEWADLIVAANYRGTALMHAMLGGKPVVYLLTEEAPITARRDFPYHIFSRGTEVVTTPEEFWNLIRRFLTDPHVAESLSVKASTFAERELNDETFPPFADLIDRLTL